MSMEERGCHGCRGLLRMAFSKWEEVFLPSVFFMHHLPRAREGVRISEEGEEKEVGAKKEGVAYFFQLLHPQPILVAIFSFYVYSLNKDILSLPPPTPVDLPGSQTAGRLNFLRDTFGILVRDDDGHQNKSEATPHFWVSFVNAVA